MHSHESLNCMFATSWVVSSYSIHHKIHQSKASTQQLVYFLSFECSESDGNKLPGVRLSHVSKRGGAACRVCIAQ